MREEFLRSIFRRRTQPEEIRNCGWSLPHKFALPTAATSRIRHYGYECSALLFAEGAEVHRVSFSTTLEDVFEVVF